MKTINELTESEFKILLDEYFAPKAKRSKMTTSEIKELAERLNKKINVPIISETGEEKILIKIIIKIDQFLYDHLPNEFYSLVRDMDQGINDDEASRLIIRLTDLANDKIDIPYLPEIAEKIAIRFVISIVINAARKKWSLQTAQSTITQIEVPENKILTSQDISMLIPDNTSSQIA